MTQALNLANLANSVNSSGQLAGSAVNGAVASATNATNATNLTGGTCTIGTTQLGAGNASIMKNRIINGAMVIDQRNAGASYTVPGGNSSAYYTIDRWSIQSIGSNVFTTQQSSTVPVGFSTSLKITVASAQSIGSSDYYELQQPIEGYNIADMQWGTANAKTVTLSFWAYSSLTGTFSGSLRNSDASRSYAFTYSIASANTWTYCTVTIAGDTSGTWQTTNSTGIILGFDLGSGSSRKGSAGSWQSSNLYGVTGSVTLASNASATLYLAGVQLEVGSSATGFEYRQYGQELALCQRYYEPNYNWIILAAQTSNLSNGSFNIGFLVQKRDVPTMTFYPNTAGGTQGAFTTNTGFIYYDNTNATKQLGSSSNTIAWKASAEL